VRVEDKDLDCRLEAEVIYDEDEEAESAVFTNTYKKEDSGGDDEDDSGEDADSGDNPDSGNDADILPRAR